MRGCLCDDRADLNDDKVPPGLLSTCSIWAAVRTLRLRWRFLFQTPTIPDDSWKGTFKIGVLSNFVSFGSHRSRLFCYFAFLTLLARVWCRVWKKKGKVVFPSKQRNVLGVGKMAEDQLSGMYLTSKRSPSPSLILCSCIFCSNANPSSQGPGTRAAACFCICAYLPRFESWFGNRIVLQIQYLIIATRSSTANEKSFDLGHRYGYQITRRTG